MKQPRYYSLDGLQHHGKFLVRHSSSIFSSLCSSCTNPQTMDMDEIWPLEQKMTHSKISIKKIINGSRIGEGMMMRRGRNYSHEYKKSQMSCVQGECFSKTSHGLGDESINEHQLQGSIRIPNKIFFTYNKKPDIINNAINNCKTVNVVSNNNNYNHDKIKQGRSAKMEKHRTAKKKIEEVLSDVLELNGKIKHIEQQQNQQIIKQEFKFMNGGSKIPTISQVQTNLGHFSFGHHQKSYFMSKLKGQVIVQKKPTQTIKQLQQSLFQLSSQNNENRLNQRKAKKQKSQKDYVQFNRNTFGKEAYFHHIRKAETLNQDLKPSDSEQSVVIDNFQSYMSRLQGRGKQKQSFSNCDI